MISRQVAGFTMKTFATILLLISGLALQGCVQLTGIEKTDLSEVKPGTNRQAVEAVLGEPVETAEFDSGLAAAYKYSGREAQSVLSDPHIAYYALMPFLWPFVEHEARDIKKSWELFLTIVYDEQDHIVSVFANNQIETVLKAANGDSKAQYRLAEAQYWLALRIEPGTLAQWSLYCRAAHGGHSRAAYEVSQDYIKVGGAVGRNQTKALTWLSLASSFFEVEDQTVTQIKYWRPRFQREILNLKLRLSPDQIAEAERLVAEWEPNPAECEDIAAQSDN